MENRWTPEQKNAIEARGGSVLVSAAAGSGKTAVLVARVIGRICDATSPCDADKLLIVTFTRAAAAEMRERITAAINEGLRKNPSDITLRRQQLLLPNAKICTIDSFCSSLVRDCFERLDISPDFRTIDEAQQSILRQTAMESILEYMYRDGGDAFKKLAGLFYGGRDDSALCEAINSLYDNSRAYPFPDMWLDSLYDSICEKDVMKTNGGKIIMSQVSEAVTYCLHSLHIMKKLTQSDKALEAAFSNCITSDEAQLLSLREYCRKGDWDAVYNSICNFDFVRKGIAPKAYKGSDTDSELTLRRDAIKQAIKKLPSYMCTDSETFKDDAEYFKSPVGSLIETVKLFAQEFLRLKTEKNAADFADIEHMALSLLVELDGEKKPVRTELARELSERYEEILIDEYQDTNEAQNMLFESLSRDKKNLFRVGDVKQSIYRFRQAMPDIFLRLRNRYSDFDGTSYPSKINFDANFRSRDTVTSSVNFVFSQLMSKQCGELDYDSSESLKAKAAFPDNNKARTHLHVLELNDDSVSKDEAQAEYISGIINGLLSDGFEIKDGEGTRTIKKSDICVLLRSVSSRGALYADVFSGNGIDSFTEVSTDFFEASEIAVMLSLLRIIDNPRQDVPLISAMLSAIFGFTPDEAAKLQTHAEGDCLYTRAVYLANNGYKKYADFLEQLRVLRLLSTSLCADELLRKIYEQTGFLAAVTAMKDGAKRKANLLLLIDYAANYEQAGYIGLSGFIRFIDRLDRGDKTLSGSLAVSDTADVVRIMSIHKSKGLEFPVVILANCAGQFNTLDERGGFVLDPMMGMGLKRRDEATLARFDTVSCAGTRLSLRRASISEEMRVLYVAMTRAKEKLIMVTALKQPEKTLSNLSADIFPNTEKQQAFCVANAKSYSDWLLTAFLRHPDCGELRSLAGVNNDIVINCKDKMSLTVSQVAKPDEPKAVNIQQALSDCSLIKEISDKLSYVYKYEPLTGILTKRTASGANEASLDEEYFASSRPAFLSDGKLTAAQKGTATHRFMQFCDYTLKKPDIKFEKERLVNSGFLTQEEADAVNEKRLSDFFESSLYERIKKSARVWREKRFMIQVPLKELYPELPEYIEEKQLIQGIADCAFTEDSKLVIVDYKTDAVTDINELRDRYAHQLSVYAIALKECTGLEVKQTLLWSFYLSREIECEI